MRSWVLALRDLRLELRGRAGLLSAFSFIAVVLFIMGIAFGPDDANLRRAGPGALWVALAFAGSMLASRAWAIEVENETLDDLLLTPGSREWIYAGKMLFLWILMLLMGLFLLVLVAAWFQLPLERWPQLLVTLLLGGTGYTAVSAFYAGLTVRLRARDVLLYLLVFPLILPVVLAAVKATIGIAFGADFAEVVSWWKLLGVFDVVYLTLCYLLFPAVIEG